MVILSHILKSIFNFLVLHNIQKRMENKKLKAINPY